MKVEIKQSETYKELEVIIKCAFIDKRLQWLITKLEQYSSSVTGEKDGELCTLYFQDIYYFDTVDNKTFAYGDKDVYRVAYKLYELVEKLEGTQFVKISKAMILNIDYLKKVKVIADNRMEGTLENGEKVIISRRYIKGLKQRLEI